jgi:hypothetical protein
MNIIKIGEKEISLKINSLLNPVLSIFNSIPLVDVLKKEPKIDQIKAVDVTKKRLTKDRLLGASKESLIYSEKSYYTPGFVEGLKKLLPSAKKFKKLDLSQQNRIQKRINRLFIEEFNYKSYIKKADRATHVVESLLPLQMRAFEEILMASWKAPIPKARKSWPNHIKTLTLLLLIELMQLISQVAPDNYFLPDDALLAEVLEEELCSNTIFCNVVGLITKDAYKNLNTQSPNEQDGNFLV